MQQYLVFECSKCHQFTYAKTSQKGKKCPRCGRNHVVSSLIGIVVDGPTKAMLEVKKRQNMMGTDISKGFTGYSKEITIHQQDVPSKKEVFVNEEGSDFKDFLDHLYEFQKLNSITKEQGFPEYVLEIVLEDLSFPKHLRKRLLKFIISYNKLRILTNKNYYLSR